MKQTRDKAIDLSRVCRELAQSWCTLPQIGDALQQNREPVAKAYFAIGATEVGIFFLHAKYLIVS